VQAHSISMIMKPVANTFGIAAMIGDSGKVNGTVLFSGTV
jgi:hypothetical protein